MKFASWSGAFGLLLTFALVLLPSRSNEEGAPKAKKTEEKVEKPPILLSAPEEQLQQALTLLKKNDPLAASKKLAGLAVALPHLKDYLLFLDGQALAASKLHQEAAAKFLAASKIPDSRFRDQALLKRADALYAQKQYRAALAEYEKIMPAFAEQPQRPQITLAIGRCLRRLGQKQKAVKALQKIWLLYPALAVGEQAQEELQVIAASKFRITPPTLSQLIERIDRLRRAKKFEQAVAELKQLKQQKKNEPATIARLNLELIFTHLRANQPSEALPLLQAQMKTAHGGSWNEQIMLAYTLGELGKIDEGAQVLLAKVRDNVEKITRQPPLAKTKKGHGRLRPSPIAVRQSFKRIEHMRISRAAEFYADFAKPEQALEQFERLYEPKALRPELIRQRAWLLYRAGKFDEAATEFTRWLKYAPASRPFGWYWQARALARNGQTEEAQTLYQKIVEDYPDHYYGLLARSRLVDLGKKKLTAKNCPAPTGDSLDDEKIKDNTLRLLQNFVEKYEKYFPQAKRALTFLRLGLEELGQRELSVLAVDFARLREKRRPRWYIVRPSLERMWRGGPLTARKTGALEKEIFAKRQEIQPALSSLLIEAGIFFYGWRFMADDKNPVDQFPLAYKYVVLKVAKQYNLPPHLLWAIMRTESGYRVDVISRVGAIGLMQLMPATASLIAQSLELDDFEVTQLFMPQINLHMAGWYLRQVLDKFHGQVRLAAAAYNGGPHNVGRWLNMRGRGAEADEFIEEIPFSESRRYAKKIVRLIAIYDQVHCQKNDQYLSNKLRVDFLEQPSY